ncbi:MAG: DnaJ domain-containing protein [Caulobacteraceae bacterium]
MGLYDDLGVARDASAASVKAAHRAAAKRDHPDRGGDRVRFDRIQRAYDVLGDPERRRHYDETGAYDESPESAEEQEALGLVQRLVIELTFGPADLTTLDLIGAALAAAKAGRDKAEAATAVTERNLERLAVVRGRLERRSTEGADPIAALLDHQERELHLNRPKIARALRVHDRAIALLQDYSYRLDLRGGTVEVSYSNDGVSMRIARNG